MWSDSVVVDPPCLDLLLGVGETDKPVLVEALVAKLAVKAFDVRILNRFTGSDETQRHVTSETNRRSSLVRSPVLDAATNALNRRCCEVDLTGARRLPET